MSGYFASILQGALLTVGVSLAALLVAIVLGLLGAVAKLSGRPALVGLATVYTTLVRGIPELVLMLLIFYGGQIGINRLAESQGWGYIDVPPFAWHPDLQYIAYLNFFNAIKREIFEVL